jgi:hypothetical protein
MIKAVFVFFCLVAALLIISSFPEGILKLNGIVSLLCISFILIVSQKGDDVNGQNPNLPGPSLRVLSKRGKHFCTFCGSDKKGDRHLFHE